LPATKSTTTISTNAAMGTRIKMIFTSDYGRAISSGRCQL
jgi:hypothetical protein